MYFHDASRRTVSTILTQDERLKVDAAGVGYYRTLHRERISDVLTDLGQQEAGAVIVSVSRSGEYDHRAIRALVAEAALVPTIALVSRVDPDTPKLLFNLGHWGLTDIVDVRNREGWSELRRCLMERVNDTVEAALLSGIRDILGDDARSALAFFRLLVRKSRATGSVRRVCEDLTLLPSTLMSRFFRAGLPAPKQYLARIRLIRAAYLFRNPGFSIANVANHLEYSSPQSFGRHIRIMTGMTALEFRRDFPVERLIDAFMGELIVPFRKELLHFDPVTVPNYRILAG